ncbi:MAG TPA: DUF928 domain-containing protein [Burkholderiales bacterium]
MKIPAILLALALAVPAALAQAPAKDDKDSANSAPVYTPPQRGAPQRRVGGSSRGVESALPRVILLVPDHVGLTVSENPPLYWYLSKPTSVRVEVTLIDDKGETPLIEYSVNAAKGPAVHRIDLAAHKVALKPNVTYQWSISVVPNLSERSLDVMSGGALRRVAMPGTLAARRAQLTDKAQLARAYAAEGIWYDSIALYSELIDQNPGDKKLREARASLLEQVGLREVAAYDRRPE